MIQLYWKHATAEIVGDANGITPRDLQEIEPRIVHAHSMVADQCREGKLGYAALPANVEYRTAVKALVNRHRQLTTDLVVLGIGGSALGNLAVQGALNPAAYNLMTSRQRGGPRLFVLDNIDPALVHETLKLLGRRLKTTLFNVISKSGETAETVSQFLIVRELLRKRLGASFARQIVATTDAAKGTLREIAAADGYDTLPVPADVGGRFSVLSPVGLFPAAMCGIDIDEMLAGAAAMKDRVEQPQWETNPACLLAAIQYLAFTAKAKPMHVMMPYSNRLVPLADWYRQLWAESLGKRLCRDGREVFTGPTPIKALGATDQHSQLQLYCEGPNDKLVIFLEVAKHPADVRIPDVFGDVPGLTYLRKARLSKLLAAEKQATEYALAVSQRPSVTLKFNAITPHAVGEFFYLYEYTTSLMAELLDVEAYDQPAVELGKQATFALMGRDGYAETAREMKPFLKRDKKYLA